MSFGARRLNYTQRRRIKHEHAAITTLDATGGEAPTFEAELDLTGYSLPGDAPVFVEAYRQSAYQRFDFGTVGMLQRPEDCALKGFGGGEGVHFRVKVIQPFQITVPGATGLARILAQADKISPKQAGRRRSLLHLEPWDSRDEVWRLEIDIDTGPLLKISRQLAPDRFAFARHPAFITLALPEILRRVLTMAIEAGVTNDEDEGSWQAKWTGLACRIAGIAEPPEDIVEDEYARNRWIDEVVTRFCRIHGIARAFSGWKAKEGDA